MPYIQLNDRQFPLRPGETRVGTGATAGIRLQQAEMPGIQAVVSVTPDQRVFIRRASADASVRVNGVVLGAEPSPLLHGDKIEIGGDELLFGDDRKGGQTQYISSEALPPLALPDTPGRPARPTAATGGRLISLVDGREYAVPATGLSIGRDAGCDVVVPGGDVSRRHAEVVPGETGYVLIDQSTNGVFVNGARIARSQLLGRGDVVRVGGEEFRFHADAVAAAASPVAAAAPAAPSAPSAPRATAGAPTPVSSPAATPAATPAAAPSAPASVAASTPAAGSPYTPAPAAASRPVLATLEVISSGVLRGQRFELAFPLAHIGRGAHNDVVLADESVSDAHAKLQRREDGWYVVDMGSTNGTYAAGKRVTSERPVGDMVELRFGGVKTTFRTAGAGADDARSTRAIAGMNVDQARRLAAREAAPPASAPARSGRPGWLWVLALALVAGAAYFFLQGR